MILETTNTPEKVLHQLSDSTFAERFGDIRLVFEGGEVVDYYRALLSLLSHEWGELLQLLPNSDTVMLTGMDVRQFFNPAALPNERRELETIHNKNDVDFEEINKYNIEDKNQYDCEPDEVANHNQDEFYTKPEEQVIDLSGHSGPTYLAGILEDFSWPGHLEGPGHHSVGWRKAPGQPGEILDIFGNRSLHTVLAEQGGLPDHAAFLLPHLLHPESQLGGLLHLRDFINGQAATSCRAFQLQGEGGIVSHLCTSHHHPKLNPPLG